MPDIKEEEDAILKQASLPIIGIPSFHFNATLRFVLDSFFDLFGGMPSSTQTVSVCCEGQRKRVMIRIIALGIASSLMLRLAPSWVCTLKSLQK